MTNFGATSSNAPIPAGSLANASWTNATLLNSWTQDGTSNTVGYYSAGGFVYLRGALAGGASAVTIFTISPVPTHSQFFPVVVATNSLGVLKVDTSGNVSMASTANLGFVSIEGVRVSL